MNLLRILRSHAEDPPQIARAADRLLHLGSHPQQALKAVNGALQIFLSDQQSASTPLRKLKERALKQTLDQMYEEADPAFSKPKEVFRLYVADLATRNGGGDHPHHVGAWLSLLPNEPTIAFLPMALLDSGSHTIKIGEWIRYLEWLEATGRPLHVKVERIHARAPHHQDLIVSLAYPLQTPRLTPKQRPARENFPLPILVKPEEIPRFDASHIDPDNPANAFWQLTADQLRNNVTALLDFLEVPTTSVVANQSSGQRPLLLAPPWPAALNLDPDPAAQQTSQKVGARHLPYDISQAVRELKNSKPGVVVIQTPPPQIDADQWEEIWSLIDPGGWLLLIQRPVDFQREPTLQPAYDQFIAQFHSQDRPDHPAEIWIVGPEDAPGKSLAIAVQKPEGISPHSAAGMEEFNPRHGARKWKEVSVERRKLEETLRRIGKTLTVRFVALFHTPPLSPEQIAGFDRAGFHAYELPRSVVRAFLEGKPTAVRKHPFWPRFLEASRALLEKNP